MIATRIVVDMQPSFTASAKPEVLVGVTEELVRAKEEQAPVIFLEYKDFEQTYSALTDIFLKYPWAYTATKAINDGSEEAIKLIKKKKLNPFYLRVCGVNTDACVHATVVGLLDHYKRSKIEVVKKGCGCHCYNGHDWLTFIQHKNLKCV